MTPRELRETMMWLQIIARKKLAEERGASEVIEECDEMIAIFVSITKTADGGG